jgi:hypothetical protein
MSDEMPTPLELKALDMALSVDFDWARALREQIPMLRVKSREHTGVGVFVEFSVASNCLPAHVPQEALWHPPAILIRHREMPELGNFIVFSKDGFIHMLEGVAHGDGVWPKEQRVEDFELFPQGTGVPPD